MSVKKRIFKLNIFMIIASLLVLVTVITGFVRITTRQSLNSNRWITDIDENASYVQQIMKGLSNQIMDWEVLMEQVREYGYDLVVVKEEEVVFCSIPGDVTPQFDKARWNKGEGIHSVFGITYVDCVVRIEQEEYYIISIKEFEEEMEQEVKRMFSEFGYKMLGICLLTVSVLILISWVFSKPLVDKILHPLEQLKKGAKRVAEGDLEKPILYQGDVEFEEVCKAFNIMQEKVKQHQEEQKKYEQNRTDMVASISHDLRTPLTSIKGYMKGILDGVANTKEKQDQYLKIAYETTDEMDLLLQKLFLFSKIETGKMPFDFEQLSLSEYIYQYTESRRGSSMEKGLELRTSIGKSDYEGEYDMIQIQRVLDNILENSLKYANRERVILEIEYKETKEEEILRMKDNGNGIPYDKLPFVFERFYRCDEARGTEGNGVGLYVVKYIVEAHGGRITAENKNGLLLSIYFPKQKLSLEGGKEQ